MRQIGQLQNPELAHTCTDYLYTLSISARAQQDGTTWAIWICDEDHVARGRQELQAFQDHPSDPRYAQAAQAARALRRQEELAEEAHARRAQQTEEEPREEEPVTPPPAPRPWTLLLVIACVSVAFGSNFGEDRYDPVMQALFIAPFRPAENNQITWNYLDSLVQGQYWRLITPIFIHFGPLHLFFNMLMLIFLGGEVEVKRGPVRYLLLILVLAAVSNLAEYYFSLGLQEQGVIKFEPNPQFGGMSGVLYGLFGYSWMKSRFEPSLGLDITPLTAASMLAWFFLCLAGAVGDIANVAHAVGLVLGVAIGYAPTVWKQVRGR
jgi:GlpG protein